MSQSDRSDKSPNPLPFLAIALAVWALFVGIGAAIYIEPYQPIRLVIVVTSMTLFLAMWGSAVLAAKREAKRRTTSKDQTLRSSRAGFLSAICSGGCLLMLGIQAFGWAPLNHAMISWAELFLIPVASVAAIVSLSDPLPRAGKGLAAGSLATVVVILFAYYWLATRAAVQADLPTSRPVVLAHNEPFASLR